MSDYRKIYEEATEEKIQPGEVIHHIDHNRENNHISNLLKLPKETHIEYHYIVNQVNIIIAFRKNISKDVNDVIEDIPKSKLTANFVHYSFHTIRENFYKLTEYLQKLEDIVHNFENRQYLKYCVIRRIKPNYKSMSKYMEKIYKYGEAKWES